MSYIGKSPSGSGVRTRYYFTQSSGGGTSISGTDDNGKTLTYTDGEYVDVYLNGVLLVHGTDYGTGTANTISSLAALASGDVVEVVVYDIFNVAKINNEAVRKRYYKTASGSETSISGADDSGATITFPANAEIEVKLNGVALVQGTDYNTTTANTVGGLSALSAGQVVEVVVYERFVLGDTVSKADGGTFAKPVGIDSSGAVALTVDRASSDGAIIDVQKDGSSVGSVGTDGGDLYIASSASGHEGLRFGNGAIVPVDTAGSTTDNACNLGGATQRFADLYLGGDLYIGGTGSANALDEYEEGTWTPAIYYQNSDDQTNSNNDIQSGTYRKVGKLVVATCMLQWDATDARANDNIGVSGFPFNSMASPPDNEQRWTTFVTMRNTSFLANDGPVGIMLAPNGALGTFIKGNTSTANLGNEFGQNNDMFVRFTLAYHTD